MRCLYAMGLRMIICEDLDTDYHKLFLANFIKWKTKIQYGCKIVRMLMKLCSRPVHLGVMGFKTACKFCIPLTGQYLQRALLYWAIGENKKYTHIQYVYVKSGHFKGCIVSIYFLCLMILWEAFILIMSGPCSPILRVMQTSTHLHWFSGRIVVASQAACLILVAWAGGCTPVCSKIFESNETMANDNKHNDIEQNR